MTTATRPSRRNGGEGHRERSDTDIGGGGLGRPPAAPRVTDATRQDAAVKVRIGFGLGTRTLTNEAATFGAFVDALERLRLRLAVAVRAAHRRGARPAGRPRLRRRPHHEAQARHERAGGARPQPGGAGQGAGHRSTGCRAAACCPRSGSVRRSRSSTGRSASTARSGRPGSTRRWGSCAGCGPRTTSPTTAPASTSRT